MQSNLGRVSVIQTPASNSTENIKTLTPVLNFGGEKIATTSFTVTFPAFTSSAAIIRIT